MRLRSRLGLSLFVLAALVGVGCGSSSRVRFTTPEEAFRRGEAELGRKRYDRAIEAYQAVFDFGRTNEWSDDAQLGLARAYVGSEQYILAGNAYTSFVELYRQDPRAAAAEFERAQAYERQSPEFALDQTETQRAVEAYRVFVSRYPEDPNRPAAEARIVALRDKLAHKLFAAGQLYERRELFEAAGLTYERTFAEYPDASWADDALAGAARAYVRFAEGSVRARQPERYGKAVAHAERLAQLFPASPFRAEVDALAARARAAGATTAQR